jgi:diguanylate cyclase (GGDEF)-like protein/PAS domain S-box-containing protein
MSRSTDSVVDACQPSGWLAALGQRMRALFARLPQGKTLPPEVWRTRHRFMLGVIWLQLAGLTVASLVLHESAGAMTFGLLPILVCASAAALPTGSRRLRGSMVAFAALYCSAALVNLAHGATEAHFHFFVMVAMLASYEEWVPYLLAIGFVVVDHGLIGVFDPRAVYSNPSAIASPWKWALIHGGFVVALSTVNVISWRLNEDVRAAAADALERTRRSEAEFRDAFEDAPIGMAIVDLNGRFERVNRALGQVTGFAPEQLLEMRLSDIAIEHDEPASASSTERAASECQLVQADGSRGWGLLQRSIARDANGDPSHVLVQLLDLTSRKQAELQLAHAAEHDVLTGLPNRAYFERRAHMAIAALGDGRALALLFVDLDNFKVINDSLGHDAGDRLLVLVADRLRGVLRPDDVLARFGGDEFVILLPDTDEQGATATANRLRAELGRPCDLQGQRRFITASVGLTLSDRVDVSASDLLRDGDAAMYRAKISGKDSHVLFDPKLRGEAVRRLELEDGLREALEREQFELHYQLEFDLRTHATFGVEALIRWRRTDGSLVPPNDFIPIAEQSGLIVPIGRWVLDEACRQGAEWRAAGIMPDDSLMSVNLSQVQLVHAEIVRDVAVALERHQLPARVLCLEITESAVMLDPERANQALAELKRLGVRLAIDDFGTGYSSLAHLKHLMPVDILKIDRSFVHGLAEGPEDVAIVTAVVELAAKLGLVTVAEGIEEHGQAARLRQMHCTVGQGFVFARPEPAAKVAELLAQQQLDQAA